MALTNAQIHNWVAELVSIKAEIDRLNRRKHEIGGKLGLGTWRSIDIPLTKVVVGAGNKGWSVSWKAVAEDILGRPFKNNDPLILGHRSRTFRKPTVSVQRDYAKALNPALKRA